MKDDTDYRRKYEDAIKRAEKEILACGSLDCDAARLIYRIFPVEFTSEDERIRKALLNEFTHLLSKGCNKFAGLKHEDIITWLEKQGKVEIEKPITIGKCKLTGKAAELAKEVTPESLEEAKEKLNAEEELNQHLNEEIQDWYENSEHMDSLWCTVKDAIELTARHFFELGLEHKQKVWTKEDESMCKDLISYFNYNPLKYSEESVCNWLKSIKERLL